MLRGLAHLLEEELSLLEAQEPARFVRLLKPTLRKHNLKSAKRLKVDQNSRLETTTYVLHGQDDRKRYGFAPPRFLFGSSRISQEAAVA